MIHGYIGLHDLYEGNIYRNPIYSLGVKTMVKLVDIPSNQFWDLRGTGYVHVSMAPVPFHLSTNLTAEQMDVKSGFVASSM